MIVNEEMYKKKLLLAQMMAVVVLLIAPLLYLFIAKQFNFPEFDPTANLLLFRILLVVAIVYPFSLPIMRNAQVKIVKKGKQKDATQAFFALMIIQMALVEVAYILGFVVYMVTHNFEWMLYFYPIGLVWTVIYFPRKSMMTTFMEKVQSP